MNLFNTQLLNESSQLSRRLNECNTIAILGTKVKHVGELLATIA